MADELSNPFEEFSSEINQAVDGLMWLGHIEELVEWCGHEFVIRTLKADEELQAGLLAKEYIDTYGQVKANAWAHVAAALVAVDGEENFCPAIGPSKKEHLRAKFNYITQNWYWPTGAKIFGEYSELVLRQSQAIKAIEDLSSRSLTTSWPSSDSSTEAGASEEGSTDSKSSASPTSSEEKSETPPN